uniref:Uncharacterized protein n=1 Tax=Wuchereria bancrofti TaxID=6293 RepID=A0A1I8EZG0_WUCBA
MNLDIWLKNSKCCSKNQESTVNDNYKDAEMLEKEIQTEAEFVFRNGALKLIAEYGISETYRTPKPLSDIECLKDQVLQNSFSTLEIQALRDLRSGEVTSYIEVLNDRNAETGFQTQKVFQILWVLQATFLLCPASGFDAEVENVLRLSDVDAATDENLEEEAYLRFIGKFCRLSRILFYVLQLKITFFRSGHNFLLNLFHLEKPNLYFTSGLQL